MYLGIDIGTQGVKALLYDADAARIAAVQQAPLELISEPDGTREQLASWWVQGLLQCLQGFAPAERARVRALAVSGQQHGCVALDAAGAVLAPVKLWCDTATEVECEEITAAFGGRERCLAELGELAREDLARQQAELHSTPSLSLPVHQTPYPSWGLSSLLRRS